MKERCFVLLFAGVFVMFAACTTYADLEKQRGYGMSHTYEADLAVAMRAAHEILLEVPLVVDEVDLALGRIRAQRPDVPFRPGILVTVWFSPSKEAGCVDAELVQAVVQGYPPNLPDYGNFLHNAMKKRFRQVR